MNTTKSAAELIKRYTFGHHNVNDRVIHTGRMPSASAVARELPESFVERPEWADGWFRRVWTSDSEMSVVIYCEGDLQISLHEKREDYDREIKEATEFYENH